MTAKIDSPEWEPLLKELGVYCTLESALNMAMIKEGIAGNVKAFVAIRDTLKTEDEVKRQKAEIEKQRLESDGFMEALKGAADGCLKEAGDFIET